jgi:hypothetical protein
MEGQIPALIHATEQTLSELPERHIYDHPATGYSVTVDAPKTVFQY